MSVYVDDSRHPLGRMVMCHMLADNTDELHTFAARIGVARRWAQRSGTTDEHYDICLSKRARAIALGAIEITAREAAQMRRARSGSRAYLVNMVGR